MCFNPIKIKNSEGPVPCGKCPKCRDSRAAGWAFRLLQQLRDQSTTSAYFLTLTYDESQLPRNDQGYPTLDKKAVQSFIKRLRKYEGKRGKTIRYYAVGEYGGQTERPHYHIILFNAKVKNVEKAWSYDQSERAKANRANSLRRRKRSKHMLHSEIHSKTKNNKEK